MKILIDNGHGRETPGKRSPDGRLLEYAYTRDIARHLPGMRLRTDYTDGDPDLKKNFYILLHTASPSVLSESLYMDNADDCAFLLTPEGQQSLVDLHVDGICAYLGQ